MPSTHLNASFAPRSTSGIASRYKRTRSTKPSHRDEDEVDNGESSEYTSLLPRILMGQNQRYSDSERVWVRWPARTLQAARDVLMSSYVNVLLIFVPLGIVAGAVGWNSKAVFAFNFLAITPLVALVSFAAEELAMKLGQTLGGILNATLGNSVELILGIVALKNGDVYTVQSLLLGSLTFWLLAGLGCSFIAAGIHSKETLFNETIVSIGTVITTLGTAALIIPSTLYGILVSPKEPYQGGILVISCSTSLILLALFLVYLVFQLKTHVALFDEASMEGIEEEPEPILSPFVALATLILALVLTVICSTYLIDNIPSSGHGLIGQTFVRFVLLPLIGSPPEFITAIIVAWKGKLDLSIGCVLGSSIQVALLIMPLLVILGWIIGKPLTLNFDAFEASMALLATLASYLVLLKGKTNYLDGTLLIGIYIIVATVAFVYPV